MRAICYYKDGGNDFFVIIKRGECIFGTVEGKLLIKAIRILKLVNVSIIWIKWKKNTEKAAKTTSRWEKKYFKN